MVPAGVVVAVVVVGPAATNMLIQSAKGARRQWMYRKEEGEWKYRRQHKGGVYYREQAKRPTIHREK
jgi:hypothetical protein